MDYIVNNENFPIRKKYIYLNHCGVSPMYSEGVLAQGEFNQNHCENGISVFGMYPDILGDLHKQLGQLLSVPAEDTSFLKNTAEAMSLIAEGYPFESGDEIISYKYEYPSNHYPWKSQERRGVKLVLIGDDSSTKGEDGIPQAWSLQDLERSITKKTRMIALSHVQFTSGYAADLTALGNLCKQHNIDLVIDAAQSLGCLPIYPAKWNVAAVAASGWKWLLGPIGSGLLYTAPSFRDKLAFAASGADLMKQGDDYLNHTWDPYTSGRRFEYSTACVSAALSMTTNLKKLFNHYGIENISKTINDHRNILLDGLDDGFFQYTGFSQIHRSGINSFRLPSQINPVDFSKRATQAGVFCSARGGYLRLAPHFYTTKEELAKAIGILNELGHS